MAGIELLAGALFEVQRQKTADPTLKKIFSTFVADEKRHSAVASRLAQHYDVHHYRDYTESPSLTSFRPHFLALVENTSPEIANAYITSGELILDVALLRSLDDYVADEMSHARDAPDQPRRVAPHRDRLPHDRALLLGRATSPRSGCGRGPSVREIASGTARARDA